MPHRRRWPRYSIASILFLVLCCAGFFAGYHQGVNTGYERWLQDKTAVRELQVKYDVGDLIDSDATTAASRLAALRSLSAEIETIIDPSYALNTAPYPAGQSIVVSTDLTTHRQIEQLLTEKRQINETDGKCRRRWAIFVADQKLLHNQRFTSIIVTNVQCSRATQEASCFDCNNKPVRRALPRDSRW